MHHNMAHLTIKVDSIIYEEDEPRPSNVVNQQLLSNRLTISHSEGKGKSSSGSTNRPQDQANPFDDFPQKDDDVWLQDPDSPIA